jgi:hypothetical protein
MKSTITPEAKQVKIKPVNPLELGAGACHSPKNLVSQECFTVGFDIVFEMFR